MVHLCYTRCVGQCDDGSARRNESSLIAAHRRNGETKQIAIERQGTIKVSHFQVNVANAGVVGDGVRGHKQWK